MSRPSGRLAPCTGAAHYAPRGQFRYGIQSTMENHMNARKLLWAVFPLAVALPLQAYADDPVEPNAGNWKTWVISSGKDYRAPPPPRPAETQAELRALAALISHNDGQAEQQIKYWDAGAPAYRWMDLINSRVLAGTPTTAYPHRVYTYVALAMHDATIATWESKYFYNRQRPSERNHKLPTALSVPNSPSYPSEHAATAQAAAAVLAYFLPQEAQSFQTMAEQAGWSRVLAGLQYPSDYYAGLELGRKVAEQVIAKAQVRRIGCGLGRQRADRTLQMDRHKSAQRHGGELEAAAAFLSQPIQAGASTGVRLTAGGCRDGPRQELPARSSGEPGDIRDQLQGLLLAEPGRPEWLALSLRGQMDRRGSPRPECSARRESVRAGGGGHVRRVHCKPGRQVHVLVHQAAPTRLVDRAVDSGPTVPELPLESFDVFDGTRGGACLPVPGTSRLHSRFGKEGGDSRIWGGIHYPMDNEAGVQLGKSVAQVFITRAQTDGSQ
jgi:membrane-associated phospholipid phosphatase